MVFFNELGAEPVSFVYNRTTAAQMGLYACGRYLHSAGEDRVLNTPYESRQTLSAGEDRLLNTPYESRILEDTPCG